MIGSLEPYPNTNRCVFKILQAQLTTGLPIFP